MLLKTILYKKTINQIASSLRFCHKFKNGENPKFDLEYLTNPANLSEITKNISRRKGVGDIKVVQELHERLKNENLDESTKTELSKQLESELKKIPNRTHPDVSEYGDDPKIVGYFNEKPQFKHKPLEFSEIGKKLNVIRTEYLGNFTGHRSYYLMSDLAELVRL